VIGFNGEVNIGKGGIFGLDSQLPYVAIVEMYASFSQLLRFGMRFHDMERRLAMSAMGHRRVGMGFIVGDFSLVG
jgi:hypothetical protein